MGKGIEMFGGLFVFAFSVLLIPQLLSYAVGYKAINEMTSTIVEIIEVHEGMNEEAEQEIAAWTERYPEITVDVQRTEQKDAYCYQVAGKIQIEMQLIGLKNELTASKTTRRVLN